MSANQIWPKKKILIHIEVTEPIEGSRLKSYSNQKLGEIHDDVKLLMQGTTSCPKRAKKCLASAV